jgi:hypothetical protein
MLAFCGDWHGAFGDGIAKVKPFVDKHNATVIQVGDFGWWPVGIYPEFPFPVYWIDGNHEYFADPRTDDIHARFLWNDVLVKKPLLSLTEPTEVRKNMIYVPRGTVMEMNGKTIAFLGGAESMDKVYRREGISWFPEESIRREDEERLLDNAAGKHIDILVTHTPPIDCIVNMEGTVRSHPNNTNRWYNQSARSVQRAWEALGKPYLFCGHMHKRFKYESVFVLEEFGVILMGDGRVEYGHGEESPRPLAPLL